MQDPKTGEWCQDPALPNYLNRSASTTSGKSSQQNSDKNKNAQMPSNIMSAATDNSDNYDEGWYQDDSGNWLNQYNWKEDPDTGEWYYDDSYGGADSESGYEGNLTKFSFTRFS